MKMHGVETEDKTKNHQTKKLVIKELNKNNICEKKTTTGLPCHKATIQFWMAEKYYKVASFLSRQWDASLLRFLSSGNFFTQLPALHTKCAFKAAYSHMKIKRKRSFIVPQEIRCDFWQSWLPQPETLNSVIITGDDSIQCRTTWLTNISRPVVKYSETVVHYSSNLSLTAIPQVATKVGNTADVTEGHQRIEEK